LRRRSGHLHMRSRAGPLRRVAVPERRMKELNEMVMVEAQVGSTKVNTERG
jgi:hypothetical protein